MKIKQFRYGKDNLGYLIISGSKAIAVDGGATNEIFEYLKNNKLSLEYVVNTHSHSDHTCGNRELLNNSEAQLMTTQELSSWGKLTLDGNAINIISTPGHTTDSICLYFDNFLLSGDTLFNGKVGRCFTKDYAGFFLSIKKLLELPGKTLVFAGHDYVIEYLKQAEQIEPSNKEKISEYRKLYNPSLVVYELNSEKDVNPFIRFNKNSIINFLEEKKLETETEYLRFKSLMHFM